MEWSWPAWLVSVAAVGVSGALAWAEGNWRRRPGLAMGFANHGAMWSDLALLSMANAVIVPYLTRDWWFIAAIGLATIASGWVHAHWYHPGAAHGDHMWPTHERGSWWRDLSWSGWAHVLYVIGELTVVFGFFMHDVPANAVLFVATIFTIHLPIGLLQPRYFLSGHIATVSEQPLLAPLLIALWMVTTMKL